MIARVVNNALQGYNKSSKFIIVGIILVWLHKRYEEVVNIYFFLSCLISKKVTKICLYSVLGMRDKSDRNQKVSFLFSWS